MQKSSLKERLQNLLLFLASCTVALYAAETISYHYLGWKAGRSQVRIQESASEHGQAYDTRSSIEVIRDLRRSGRQAYPVYSPGYVVRGTLPVAKGEDGGDLLPLATLSNTTSVYGNATGQYLVEESDEHGFNNPPGLYRSGRVEAVVIGDSFAEGVCVPRERNIVGTMLKGGHSVLNLGHTGFRGPLLELATIREYAKPMRPKIVYWLYF